MAGLHVDLPCTTRFQSPSRLRPSTPPERLSDNSRASYSRSSCVGRIVRRAWWGELGGGELGGDELRGGGMRGAAAVVTHASKFPNCEAMAISVSNSCAKVATSCDAASLFMVAIKSSSSSWHATSNGVVEGRACSLPIRRGAGSYWSHSDAEPHATSTGTASLNPVIRSEPAMLCATSTSSAPPATAGR